MSRKRKIHLTAGRKTALRYFFSSVGVEGGGFVAGFGFGFGFGWSPRMPSLNSRTPCPRPRITSGILRPPKSTSTTTAIISKCIGLSHIEHLPFRTHPTPPRPVRTDFSRYSITRSSPTRRVTRSRSRYSSSGIAYFRVMPVSSLNTGIGSLSPRSLRYFASSSRSRATAVW